MKLLTSLRIVPLVLIAFGTPVADRNLAIAGDLDPGRLLPDALEVAFDVPPTVVAHEVEDPQFKLDHPDMRLWRVRTPVSLLLYKGQPTAIEDMVIEIDGAPSALQVHDYAPRTLLESDHTEPIELRHSEAIDKTLSASLGGKLGSDIALTPGLSSGQSKNSATTETETLRPPKEVVVVSGTMAGRSGVFFKVRKNSQSTLEGEQAFEVTFAAPADWQGGEIVIRCVARGQQKWLLVERHKVWSSTSQPVTLRLVSHVEPSTDQVTLAHGSD